MPANKCYILLLLACCLLALVAGDVAGSLLRRQRSVVVTAGKDQAGSPLGVYYNPLLTNRDVNRDFVNKRKEHGGAVDGRWPY
ncbi:uncharacterized protein Dvir_GJ13168 [Drosophila virilis]|uniref:Uncharacterized protein n=1 Tax=Drosophila virilis TaxID=7244 RepID=B4LFS1_DROVI|nr:uncharacterized protein LOC6622300 [Drosophila virilis]EDW69298.1 uncharacterized protein Dvir_GJ13168 [Drosophila virilis]